jgi:hypothetical protein
VKNISLDFYFNICHPNFKSITKNSARASKPKNGRFLASGPSAAKIFLAYEKYYSA